MQLRERLHLVASGANGFGLTRGWGVPDVLLSGDHGRVREWRREQSRLRGGAP